MKKGWIPEELRAAFLVIVALTVLVVIALAAVWGKLLDLGGAEMQRTRAEETFVYGKYGSLWRYDHGSKTKLASLPYADDDEQVMTYLVDWVALTADERTVYFVDMDGEYTGKLYRRRLGTKGEPEKLATDIDAYALYGSDVFYLKVNGALFKNEERILRGVANMSAVSDDGMRVLVIDSEGRLFLVPADDPVNKVRVDRGVAQAGELDRELREVFYITADDELLIYNAATKVRTSLGILARELCEEDPTAKELFYWVPDEDGEEAGLFYFDTDAHASRRISFREEVFPLKLEVFPEQGWFGALVENEDGEIDLLRCPRDGDLTHWEKVARDLEEEPRAIVCGDDGTMYYLVDAQSTWDEWYDPEAEDYDWGDWNWDEWGVYLDRVDQDDTGEAVLFADGRDLGIEASSIAWEQGRLLLVTDMDEGENFTLSVWDGMRARRIAEDVYIYRVLSDGTVVTLRDFSERSLEGDLYITRNGRDRLVERGVTWFSEASY